jgi:signal transduction histidine kinase
MGETFDKDIAAIQRLDAIPKILEVVCRATGMGFAAVARVTADRWIACAVRDEIGFGLKPGDELEVKTTICDEIRESRRAVIIDNVAEDDDFRDHHTPATYGLQSYISVPIIHRDRFFGTLCAIDPQPAKLKDTPIPAMFDLFAELIAAHLEAEERLSVSEAALLDHQEAAELREQFIAVLGHDLRNPLASIDAAGRLLKRTPLNERAVLLVEGMHKSVMRMAGLIDNVLDFARGRLGGGLGIDRQACTALPIRLAEVIQELQLANPGRRIETEIVLADDVTCDPDRLAQMLSNLLGNALTHGSEEAPIHVRAVSDGVGLEISVANGGEPIPEAFRGQLFKPFSRAAVKPTQQGLGLGLYIASEIARSHGGDLSLASDAAETRFTFRMPLSAEAPATVLSSQKA